MKMKIRANTAVITTEFTPEEYKKYAPYGAFTVQDEEGDEVYTISKSDFASALNGFSFAANTTFNDKLAVALVFEGTQEDFVAASKPALLALKQAEYAIRDNIDKIAEDLALVDEDIEIE